MDKKHPTKLIQHRTMMRRGFKMNFILPDNTIGICIYITRSKIHIVMRYKRVTQSRLTDETAFLFIQQNLY